MTEPNDVTPYAPGGPAPLSPPPRPPAPGHLVGRAEGVSVRTESDRFVQNRLVTVLAFRVRPPQNPRPREVELRGLSLTGVVRDGDWVEVADRPGPSGALAVPTVHNLTTGLPVTVTGGRSGGRVVAVVLALVLLVGLIVALGAVLSVLLVS